VRRSGRVDEPLSNLDASLRVRTRNELVRLHQRLGSTMIYVTHDQVEAMTMGSRICVMNHGKVVQVGEPIQVYRNPADTFVASFIGRMGRDTRARSGERLALHSRSRAGAAVRPGHDQGSATPAMRDAHGTAAGGGGAGSVPVITRRRRRAVALLPVSAKVY
jgi:ABC-type sugar transport system ATPase subunit